MATAARKYRAEVELMRAMGVRAAIACNISEEGEAAWKEFVEALSVE